MEADLHTTLSPVTTDTVGSDTDFPVGAGTGCSLSPEANLSLFDNIFNSYLSKCFCCTKTLAHGGRAHRSTSDRDTKGMEGN